MTTLSPTKARANLTKWLKLSAGGEEIGILYGDKVIALRPVTVVSEDPGYAGSEYGASPAELDAMVKRADSELKRDRKTGRMKPYRGDFGAAIKD